MVAVFSEGGPNHCSKPTYTALKRTLVVHPDEGLTGLHESHGKQSPVGCVGLDRPQQGLPLRAQRGQVAVQQVGRLGGHQASRLSRTLFLEIHPHAAEGVALCGELLKAPLVVGDSARAHGEDLE